ACCARCRGLPREAAWCGGYRLGSNSPLGSKSASHCVQTEPCGGPDQRACCLFEADFGACRSGLAKVPECGGNCLCSNGLGASSDSHCGKASPWGAEGERACCIGGGTLGGR